MYDYAYNNRTGTMQNLCYVVTIDHLSLEYLFGEDVIVFNFQIKKIK